MTTLTIDHVLSCSKRPRGREDPVVYPHHLVLQCLVLLLKAGQGPEVLGRDGDGPVNQLLVTLLTLLKIFITFTWLS